MAAPLEDYIAVVKAAYDYEPQSEDEVAVKENQLLFVLEKADEDWWKVKVKADSLEQEGPIGLVPAAYVEPAEHTSVVKALYDYEASAQGELSITEDEMLLVYDKEDDWLLVASQKSEGRVGFVPANYVEEASHDGDEVAPSAAAGIVIPDSPPRPAYVDPAERVAATTQKGVSDSIQTWSVSEVDKKGKKKKGTLGVGNGAVFFASEVDRTPVQKWQTADITSCRIDKSKHVMIEVGGVTPASLQFNTTKDIAEEILHKFESSRAAAGASSIDDADAHPAGRPTKNGSSVHFATSPPVMIPAREPSMDEEEIAAEEHATQDTDESGLATAIYDFVADGEDELSVSEGERLVVLEQDSDDWWKVRNMHGAEGVVPASYVELPAGASVAVHQAQAIDDDGDDDEAAREAEERADEERREREREEEERISKERTAKEKMEKERADKERRKREAAQRAQAEAEAERKRQEKEKRRAAEAEARKRQDEESRRVDDEKNKKKSGKRGGPPPEETRIWHDRTGQFRVEAALLGYNNGKLKLHKSNGVIIEVPSEKMSPEDLDFVKKFMSKKPSSATSSSSPTKHSKQDEDDDVPLAVQKKSAQPQKKKGPATDWFDFFLNAGCDVDDCSRYATSFERDKIDEAILPDITESTMRSLGLREGDIIRVKKLIEQRHPVKKEPQKDENAVQDQIRRDEELARQLQSGVKPRTTSPAPNLFAAGPNGQLATQRRGRLPSSKSVPPQNVDAKLISFDGTSSDQQQLSGTPRVASPTEVAPSAPKAAIGFDDDAWANRPSSTKAPTPTPTVVAPRAPSAPPAPTPPPAPAPAAQPIAPPAPPQSTGSSLASTTQSDVFDQLARLSALRVTPVPAPQQRALSVPPPSMLSPPPSFQSGMGMGQSPLPIGQHLQIQQTGMYQQQPQQTGMYQQQPQQSGPRGPYAPVPANQPLLQPLVPTSTGFNGFVPARPVGNASPFQSQPPSAFQQQPQFQQPPSSFLGPQQTGFNSQMVVSQPTGFNNPGAFVPQQPTGFAPAGASGSLMSQPTGVFANFNPGLPPQQTGLGMNSFGGVQSNPTGFNPGFGQFGQGAAPPQSNQTKDVTPANIFAQMKSGTFANDSAAQAPEKYDALRPTSTPLMAQPTGWGYTGTNGYQNQGGYGSYQR